MKFFNVVPQAHAKTSTPLMNMLWMKNLDRTQPLATAILEFNNSLCGDDGFGWSSSKVVNQLGLPAPLSCLADSEGRQVGYWALKHKETGVIVSLWSDGHKANPSRGTTYEIDSNAKGPDLIKAIRDLKQELLDHVPKYEPVKKKKKWYQL